MSSTLSDLKLDYASGKVGREQTTKISSIIAQYIVNKNMAKLFGVLSGDQMFDIHFARGDYSNVFLYYACCCWLTKDNVFEKFIQNYNIDDHDMRSLVNTDYFSCVSEHWRYLKIWRPKNLIYILGYKKKNILSAEDEEFYRQLYNFICANMQDIQFNTYLSLKYDNHI